MQRRAPTITIALLAALAACNSETPSPTASSSEASNPASFAKGGKHVKVVTESDVTRQLEDTPPTDNWVLYFRPPPLTGNGTFREGPGNPPQGEGSFELVTPTPDDKIQLFNFDYHETPIADFTELGYQTYQSSGLPGQLPSINLTINPHSLLVPGNFATLVFEPIYNTAQGAIVPNTWQDWDAIFGGEALWWVTRNVEGIGLRGALATWDRIKEVFPDATILGGIGPNQGSGGAALTASVDEFIVGVGGKHATIYDFEACDDRGHGNDKCKAKGHRGGNDEE
jgi:hypothetical protein